MKKCPKCGGVFDNSWKVCLHCSSILTDEVPAAMDVMKKCPYCSEQIQDDATKCRYCGEWLVREKKEPIIASNLKFPKIWPGYILALLFFVFEIGEVILFPQAAQQRISWWTILIGLIGLVYWNICVYRIHKMILVMADNCYPISPARAVGFGFLPIYNIYWMFKWPGEIINFIKARSGVKTWKPAIPGLLLLLSALAGRIDGTLWLIIDFSVLLYLTKKLKEDLSVKPESIPYKSKSTSLSAGATAAIALLLVVPILGLLAAIAIPNFIRARTTAQKNACIANLKQIQGAVKVWAVDSGAASNATFTTSDIVPHYLKSWPKEGTVDYPLPANVSDTPVCPNSSTNTDHKL